MKRSIREWQSILKVEKRKLADYEFKLKQLKEHELLLHESIEDTRVNILDYEETLQLLERMVRG
ncbi:hypothetical protein COL52_01210 [Bacillus toyonensis]|uniref:Uncharacterized protein n=1 Tax=Bacillus toyonensis TaxID=155322 RepID=A0A2B7W5V8_9BACI|nr:hypothetical protein [Bacillus toyonensis]MED3089269.1 hypothetical protein [Bacillus toyonensis]PEL15565.1 hypothetical protein CN624_31610 [Bacillus toyonensis]PFY28795.1 hypothetical protein COL54_34170 [Bacillus toyonensis]PFY65419.1 hypothetical protein COL52_01210 [Bacillus toyonensis]PGG94893.1 hypothetical protein CON73_00130 [Bacillus toyonensis]